MGVPVLPEAELVLKRLREGRLDAFIGSIEWAEFECKKSPYQLERNDQKFELAKDVSALANAGGGIILIGAGTEMRASGAAEVVNEIHPFKSDLIDARQVLDILNAWLYPPLHNIRVDWFPSSDDKSKGLAAIQVPAAPEQDRPILVAKLSADSGGIRGNMLGLFERVRDGTAHWNVPRIHATLRNGSIQDEVFDRIDALQASVDALGVASQTTNVTTQPQTAPARMAAPAAPSPASSTVPGLTTLVSNVGLTNISVVGLGERPAYILDAEPVGPVSAPNFFASRQTPFAQLVESPPEIRDGGFGIDAGLNARMHAGFSWRALYEEGHRLLEIAKDGKVRFAAPADATFLCWATKSADKPLINPIALVESAFLYVELLRRMQGLLEPRNVGYRITLSLQGLRTDQYVVCLASGAVGRFWRASAGIHEAPQTYFSTTQAWASGEIDSAVFAYECLKPIYEWFGFTHDKIPYVRDIDGRRGVDIEQIRNAKG